MTPGTAAVSYSTLHADFLNTGPGPFVGSAGAVVTATGHLSHTPGSFVELANAGKITINGVTSSFYVVEGFSYNSLLQENAINLLSPGGSASISARSDHREFQHLRGLHFGPQCLDPQGGDILGRFAADARIGPGLVDRTLFVCDPSTRHRDPHDRVLRGRADPEPSAWIQFG